jgi:pterin-4a-carbinolamine dehydratase
MMTVLEPQALEIAVARLPHWHVENGELVRIASFGDFVAAIAFVATTRSGWRWSPTMPGASPAATP